MRVALNLGGVKKEELKRGRIIATKDVFSLPSQILDVKLTISKSISEPLKNLDQLKFYYLANEIKCRVKLINRKQVNASETVYAQLLLDEAIYANNKDLGILRQINPIKTVAGVEIINTFGEYVNRKDDSYLDILALYEKQDTKQLIQQFVETHPFTKLNDLRLKLNLFDEKTENLIEIISEIGIVFEDNTCLSNKKLSNISSDITKLLEAFHEKNPHETGMSKQILQQELKLEHLANKTFNQLLMKVNSIKLINDRVKLANFTIKYNQEEQRVINALVKYLDSFDFKPPKLADILTNIRGRNVKSLYYSLIKEQELIKIDEDIVLSKKKYVEMINLFDKYFETNKVLMINDARDLLNTSRKYIVPILEYLDKIGYTRRVEEGRIKKS